MKLEKIFKILLISSIVFTSAFALKKDEIKNQMNNKVDNIINILKNKEIDTNKQTEEIIKVMDSVFDYKLMAKISLGKKTWSSISIEKKKEFTELFENKLKLSYIEKLKLYTDQKVKILDLIPYKKTRLQLTSEIVGEDKTYQINYNFYKNRKINEWLIYDIDLVGISIIQTYRKQFSGLLKEKTFDEMLVLLKDTKSN